MHTKFVSLEEATRMADLFFLLTTPFTTDQLKKSYRKAAFRLHPDQGGTEEGFKAMGAAYETLMLMRGTRGLFTFSKDDPIDFRTATTIDGTPLSSLGLGLGPTTNGRDCEHCDHKGYTVYYGKHYVVCTECDHEGKIPREFPCRSCNGTGKFQQRRSLRTIDCRVCQGTKVFKHPVQKMRCKTCNGTKTIWKDSKEEPYYEACFWCRGTGEIEIMNPVLPKGLLALF